MLVQVEVRQRPTRNSLAQKEGQNFSDIALISDRMRPSMATL